MKLTRLAAHIMFFWLAVLAATSHAQDEAGEFSQAEVDQILAPIALYPDTLLSHILIASTYPLEVVQAERWANDNSDLSGDDAVNAADLEDWDPSVKALVAFPQVLKKMSEDLDWTQSLGDAFLQDEALVLASVQDLRQRAYDQGSLSKLDHLNVERDDADNIVIESNVREVIYVPYYDTRVVYGPWWWHSYPPVYWSGHSQLSFYWGPRIHVGTGIYFSAFHWHNRHVVVTDRHHSRGHHFYTGRHVARHADSRRWAHNPSHRRGVHYRNNTVRQRHHDRVHGGSASRQTSNRNIDQRRNHSSSHDVLRERIGRHEGASERSARQRRSDNSANQRQATEQRSSTRRSTNDESTRQRRSDNSANQRQATEQRSSTRRSTNDEPTSQRRSDHSASQARSTERASSSRRSANEQSASQQSNRRDHSQNQRQASRSNQSRSNQSRSNQSRSTNSRSTRSSERRRSSSRD